MSRSHTRPLRRPAVLAAAALLAVPLAGAAAEAAPPPDARPVMGGLVSPLSVTRTPSHVTFVSENFAGKLWRKGPKQSNRQLVWKTQSGHELGAVSVSRGRITFAVSGFEDGTGKIHRIGGGDGFQTLLNTLRYERNNNPDGDVTYGLPGLSEECADQWPTEDYGPPSYQGIVESHPYATAARGRSTLVADAAMNAILRIGPGGAASTVAVLPPAPYTITQAVADSMGFPDCVVGRDYLFEAVPTDVEVGPNGKLYVTSLPGGPEDPSLGARGSVLVVDPETGDVTTLRRKLMSPTGLAVAPGGAVYVAELFGNRISRISAGGGKRRTHANVTLPADVDWSVDGLVATTQALGDEQAPPQGRVVVIAP